MLRHADRLLRDGRPAHEPARRRADRPLEAVVLRIRDNGGDPPQGLYLLHRRGPLLQRARPHVRRLLQSGPRHGLQPRGSLRHGARGRLDHRQDARRDLRPLCRSGRRRAAEPGRPVRRHGGKRPDADPVLRHGLPLHRARRGRQSGPLRRYLQRADRHDP